jgi:hypothetical protein
MTKHIRMSSALAIMLGLFTVAPAFAAGLSVSTVTSGMAKVPVSAITSTTTTTTTNTNTTTTAADSANASGAVHGALQMGLYTNDSLSTGVTISPITITQTTATTVTGNTPVVTSAEMVASQDDLSTYTAATVKGDANLVSADLSPRAVSVSYKERGYVFGFIPTWITARAEASADGTVQISYPWYGFLVSTDEVGLKSKVETSAAPTLTASGNGSVNAGATFTAQAQAELLDQVHVAMKSAYDASASANVSASATGSASY